MAESDKKENLQEMRSVVLFSGLEDEDISEIHQMALRRAFRRGQLIFNQGDPSEGFYVLVKGRVKIFKVSMDGKEQILQFVPPGYPFAEAALFSGKTYPASAQAVEDAAAYFFYSDDFRKLIITRPTIAINMIVTMAGYLRRHARTIEDLALREVSGRLAGYILERSAGEKHFDLDISKSQLAARIGTVSETISRTLAKLGERQLIEVHGSHIEILDRSGLENLLMGSE